MAPSINMSNFKINVPIFSSNDSDPCNYMNFKAAFLNALYTINCPDSTKLIFLRNNLRAPALGYVADLPADKEDSYETAIETLDSIYLDKDKIRDKLFEKIYAFSITNVASFKEFISILHVKLDELAKFECDLRIEGSPGYKLLGFLVMKKLPLFIYKEFSRKKKHPDLDTFRTYAEDILNILSCNSKPNPGRGNNNQTGPNPTSKQVERPPCSLPSLPPSTISVLCRFCPSNEHSSSKCNRFSSFSARTDRAKERGLCLKCLSSKHSVEQYPGKTVSGELYKCRVCETTGHIAPLCPNKATIKNRPSNS